MKAQLSLAGGKTLSVVMTKNGESNALLGRPHFKYYLTIEVNGLKHGFTFHDSHNNYCKGKGVSKKILLQALDCHIYDCFDYKSNNSFLDFATEFGYGDEDAGQARRAFNICRKAYEDLTEVMSWEEIMELNKIVAKELSSFYG